MEEKGYIGENEQFNIYVERSIKAGVEPLETVFTPIYDCYGEETIAISSCIKVNSVICGTVMADDYLNAPLDKKLLTDLSLRAIKKIAVSKKILEENYYKYKFLSVRCSDALIYSTELYSLIKKILLSAQTSGDKLCIEFNGTVMSIPKQTLLSAFADIRATGIKIAVRGYGEKFSMEKLLDVCPDYLLADEKVAQLVSDREKRTAVTPMIHFAKSLGGDVIACGILCDEQLSEFRLRECFGYIPHENYKGAYTGKKEFFSINSLIKAGEENV